MYVFAINGIALAGKDSFTQRVDENLIDGAATISTIDPVKEYYASIGWDGNKFLSEHRKVLNVIKKMWILGHIRIADCATPYAWVVKQCEKYQKAGYSAVFVMVREFDEMMKIKEIGDLHFSGGKTLRVVRNGLEVPLVEQEFIDSHPQDYMYDFTIMNPTTEDEDIPLLTIAADQLADLISERNNLNFSPLYWHPDAKQFVHPFFKAQIY